MIGLQLLEFAVLIPPVDVQLPLNFGRRGRFGDQDLQRARTRDIGVRRFVVARLDVKSDLIAGLQISRGQVQFVCPREFLSMPVFGLKAVENRFR